MKDVGTVERLGLLFVLGGLAAFGAAFLSYVLLPAERWMNVRDIVVHDARVGQEITMTLDREILREFDGAWRVAVWRAERGGWAPVCSTGWNDHRYRPDARVPVPTTLRWYTDKPDCYQLGPGLYRMDTEWLVNVGTWFERDIRRPDVLFEVSE